jgi:protein O-GlcNAc transferase
VAAYRRALELKPDYPEAHNNLGIALAEQGQLDEAMAAYRRALELKPDYPEAHNNLGNALKGRRGPARRSHRRVSPGARTQTRLPEAHNNLGNALKDQGQLDEAMAAYRRALQLKPEHAGAHSNLVYTLHFHPGQDERTIAEEHQTVGTGSLRNLCGNSTNLMPTTATRSAACASATSRRISPPRDLPLSDAAARGARQSARRDLLLCQREAPGRVHGAREKVGRCVARRAGLGDHALAERIRADQIDILVDLTQHMANNRLLMFARKPAPIQVAWLGYPASTGLPAMDYRFTDAFMEPEGSAWSESVETPIRLPDSWFCFDPIEYPEVAALPALEAGHITFGS